MPINDDGKIITDPSVTPFHLHNMSIPLVHHKNLH